MESEKRKKVSPFHFPFPTLFFHSLCSTFFPDCYFHPFVRPFVRSLFRLSFLFTLSSPLFSSRNRIFNPILVYYLPSLCHCHHAAFLCYFCCCCCCCCLLVILWRRVGKDMLPFVTASFFFISRQNALGSRGKYA